MSFLPAPSALFPALPVRRALPHRVLTEVAVRCWEDNGVLEDSGLRRGMALGRLQR